MRSLCGILLSTVRGFMLRFCTPHECRRQNQSIQSPQPLFHRAYELCRITHWKSILLPTPHARKLLLSKDLNPKIVSEMLGLTSLSITLDVYSHLMPDIQEKATTALQEVLG